MRRVTRLRSACIVSALMLFGCGAACAQGMFIEKQQSGLYFSGGYYGGDEFTAKNLDFGVAARGVIDFGISATTTSFTTTSFFYPADTREPIRTHTSKSDGWNTGLYLREYPLRIEDPSGGRIYLSLHQAVSWISKEFIPSDDPLQVLQLGGGAACSLPAGRILRLYVGGYFSRVIPSKNLDSYNAYSLEGTLQLPFKDGSFQIGPSVTFEEDVKTYGVSVGVTAIGLGSRD